MQLGPLPTRLERCTYCGEKISIPFVPSPDRAFFCPSCGTRKKDFLKSPYVVNFVAFLSENLELPVGSKLRIARVNAWIVQILLKEKGEKEKVLYVIKWTPIVPYLRASKATARFDTGFDIDKQLKPKLAAVVKAFVKEHGLEAPIP